MSAKVTAHIIKAHKPVRKAEQPTQLSEQAERNAGDWLNHPRDMRGLKAMVNHSSILPQCIRAYKNNIAGFGIGIRYKSGFDDNNPAALAEYEHAQEVIQLLNMDMDTKEVFEDVIEAREIYGISYTEVVRNVAGEVTGIDFILDTPSITKTSPLEPYVEVEYYFNGRIVKRKRKFRKYRQQVGGKTVYFKEIGDPRIMDKNSGEYVEKLDLNEQANEIIEFAIGAEPYGEVRWIGQVLGVDGSRMAERLNNSYFKKGRHTPLLIMLKGGTLTDDSYTKMQQYMNELEGEAGQHAFMLLEVENAANRTDFEGDKPPDIEIKELASILQKDELFQDYLDNNRRKAQSAFQLPDLYVGYTTDFNRATAQTAQEVTEKQVFQPERRSLAWTINNKLLADYQFQFVEAYFMEPDITNPDDLAKILNVAERAGGLTPNKAREIAYEIMGDIAEDYEGGWGDTPLAYTKALSATVPTEMPVEKAAPVDNDALVAVMKEVRSLLATREESP